MCPTIAPDTSLGIIGKFYLLGYNRNFSRLQHIIVVDEPTLQGFLSTKDSLNLLAIALTLDGNTSAVTHRKGYLGEEGYGNNVLGVGRRIGIKTYGIEDVP